MPRLRAKLPTGAVLTAPYAYYDDTNSYRQWAMGQLLTDVDEIEMLRQRGAPLEEFYGETSGLVVPGYVPPKAAPITKAYGTWAMQLQYQEAKRKHRVTNKAVQAMDQAFEQFSRRLDKCRRSLHPEILSEARSLVEAEQTNIFLEAAELFAGWLDTPVGEGLAKADQVTQAVASGAAA